MRRPFLVTPATTPTYSWYWLQEGNLWKYEFMDRLLEIIYSKQDDVDSERSALYRLPGAGASEVHAGASTIFRSTSYQQGVISAVGCSETNRILSSSLRQVEHRKEVRGMSVKTHVKAGTKPERIQDG